MPTSKTGVRAAEVLLTENVWVDEGLDNSMTGPSTFVQTCIIQCAPIAPSCVHGLLQPL